MCPQGRSPQRHIFVVPDLPVAPTTVASFINYVFSHCLPCLFITEVSAFFLMRSANSPRVSIVPPFVLEFVFADFFGLLLLLLVSLAFLLGGELMFLLFNYFLRDLFIFVAKQAVCIASESINACAFDVLWRWVDNNHSVTVR